MFYYYVSREILSSHYFSLMLIDLATLSEELNLLYFECRQGNVNWNLFFKHKQLR